MKAQSLLLASFFISIIIIAIAFTNIRLHTYTLETDETTEMATIFSFYTSSLAYGTNRSFYEFLNFSDDPALGYIAANKAKEFTEKYFIQSISELKSAMQNVSFNDLSNLNFMIGSNGVRGNGSAFFILVSDKSSLLANITSYIVEAKIKASNSSIGIYYFITVYVSSLYYIEKDIAWKDQEYNVSIYSNGKLINYVLQSEGNYITIITDSSYAGKILIELINEENIILWLFA